MGIEYNTGRGLEIAEKYGIQVQPGYAIKAVQYKEELKKRIENGKPGKWARRKTSKGYKTYCGQYSLFFLKKMKFNIQPFLANKKNPNDVNTTMQWKNAQKNKMIQPTMEEAFYLACVALPCQILSPYHMYVEKIHYNHSAIVWPVFTEEYNPEIGPYIAQEGWYHFYGEPISDKRAWGDAWKHEKVKCFLPEIA